MPRPFGYNPPLHVMSPKEKLKNWMTFNEKLTREVSGCANRRYGRGAHCTKHKQALGRWGHAHARALTSREMNLWSKPFDNFITDHAEAKPVQAALKYFDTLLTAPDELEDGYDKCASVTARLLSLDNQGLSAREALVKVGSVYLFHLDGGLKDQGEQVEFALAHRLVSAKKLVGASYRIGGTGERRTYTSTFMPNRTTAYAALGSMLREDLATFFRSVHAICPRPIIKKSKVAPEVAPESEPPEPELPAPDPVYQPRPFRPRHVEYHGGLRVTFV